MVISYYETKSLRLVLVVTKCTNEDDLHWKTISEFKIQNT